MVILIADDEEPVRKLMYLIIDGHGHEVLIASDGVEALKLAHSCLGAIDLLVSDIQMPGMDGVELANHLLLERPAMKVLLVSGYSRLEVPDEFPLLKKPFSPTGLLEAIRKILGIGTTA